jgi:hypothetical protein
VLVIIFCITSQEFPKNLYRLFVAAFLGDRPTQNNFFSIFKLK